MTGMHHLSQIATFLVMGITTVFAVCHATRAEDTPSAANGVCLFRSGFEPDSHIIHRGDPATSDATIVGEDRSVAPPNDWIEDINNSENLGRFSLQYQGGDTTMRFARIVPEPENPDNQVLHFWLRHPNVDNGSKGRIQGNIYAGRNDRMIGINELYQSIRVLLHEDMQVVKTYPRRISWLTIMEVWNNIQWSDDPYPFRITVGMGKLSVTESELYFMVDAEDYEYATGNRRGRYVRIWHEMNTEIPIPIGRWITLEYYIREGDKSDGRFYMAMTPEGGEKQVVFDIQNYTHNTKDPNPEGITHWNPIKLYTSRDLIHYVQREGKALQLYWDDLAIWRDRRP